MATIKATVTLLLCLLAVSCATPYQQLYYFNQIRVENDSGEALSNVTVSIRNTQLELQCDSIPAKDFCSRRYRSQRYPDQVIELSWTRPDGTPQTHQFEPEVPGFFSAPFPLRILLKLDRDGQPSIRFAQDEPFRD